MCVCVYVCGPINTFAFCACRHSYSLQQAEAFNFPFGELLEKEENKTVHYRSFSMCSFSCIIHQQPVHRSLSVKMQTKSSHANPTSLDNFCCARQSLCGTYTMQFMMIPVALSLEILRKVCSNEFKEHLKTLKSLRGTFNWL